MLGSSALLYSQTWLCSLFVAYAKKHRRGRLAELTHLDCDSLSLPDGGAKPLHTSTTGNRNRGRDTSLAASDKRGHKCNKYRSNPSGQEAK